MRKILDDKYNAYDYEGWVHKRELTKHPNNPHPQPQHTLNEVHLKTRIAIEVVAEIKAGSGRFLKEVECRSEATETEEEEETILRGCGLLVAVEDKIAVQKIKVALRDLKKRKLRLEREQHERAVFHEKLRRKKQKQDPVNAGAIEASLIAARTAAAQQANVQTTINTYRNRSDNLVGMNTSGK